MSYRLGRTGSNVEELLEKIEALVVDTEPTADSDNPVSSGGVKAALDGKVRNLSADNVLIGFNYSNIGVTPSGISLETDGSAIGMGQNVVINTVGAVEINGSEVATTAQLSGKVDKEPGKGLSTNDFTNAWKNKLMNMADIKKVDVSEIDGLISDDDEGLYFVSINTSVPFFMQMYRDGATAYQWLIEPHSGKILVRHYNTQAASPAWSELADAYADKQDTISDLATIRSGAAAGATAYQKPNTGIPKTDLASAVQTSLGKADTSVQPAALTPIQSAISVIEGLIPSAASAQNQLADKNYVDTHSSDIDVDDALSTTSENPVQNKVVTNALNGKQATISDLSTIRSGAAAGATAVQPAAMNTALASKQDTLTFDNAPTANSNNPVKSGGVKTAIDAKQDIISTVNVTVDNNTGTPSGSASVTGGTLSLSFQNLRGRRGPRGRKESRVSKVFKGRKVIRVSRVMPPAWRSSTASTRRRPTPPPTCAELTPPRLFSTRSKAVFTIDLNVTSLWSTKRMY